MEHLIYVLKGEGIVIMGEDELHIKDGDVIAVPTYIQHGVKNIGNEILGYLMFSNTAIKEKMSEPGSIVGIPVDKQ